MLSKQQIEQRCCDYINQILFQSVWNEPSSEFRYNIKPFCLKNNSCTGSFSVADANILLPKGTYYVWVMDYSDFQLGIELPSGVWVSLKDIVNQYNTLIHMYTTTGYVLNKGNVYFRYNTGRNIIFVIAEKKMCKMIPNFDMNDVYLTIYYDSDRTNPITVETLRVQSDKELNDHLRTINNFMSTVTNMDQFTCFHNGKRIQDLGSYGFVSVGDYIELINDTNVIFSFDVEMTLHSENPSFLSDKDSTWKQLIHIPKAKNPNNEIFTHNTCDFYIDSTYGNDGLYLHRVGDRTVNQVTHNDMAVPLYVVDAYRDQLGTQDVTLHGVVRRHSKDNVLIRDASYIDLLYTDVHSDEDIIKILCGKGPKDIPWWKASELEKSTYVRMMFDSPNIATTDHMKEYVDALGFYQIVNLLCHRVNDIIVTDTFTGTMTLNLPMLYTGRDVVPVIYLNGKTLRNYQFSYKVNLEDNTISVNLIEDLYVKSGDRITVVLYLTGNNRTYTFTPTENIRTISIPYSEFRVYKEISTTGTNMYKGVSNTSISSFELMEENTNQFIYTIEDDSTVSITFSESLVGTNIVIQNKICSYAQQFNLSEYTSIGKTIAIPLRGPIFDSIDTHPLLHIENISAYMNGTYLVKGIDYCLNKVVDENGNICFYEFIVQSMDHFKEGQDDVLDLLINVAEIEDISHGFAVKDELRDTTPVNLYFPNISVAHVDGTLERECEYRGTYIRLPESKFNTGSPFEIQTSVPKIVKDFITTYATNTDIERIKVLNQYFYKYGILDLPLLVLESKHRIYSTFMNTFIYDVITGKLPLVDDPDENRMVEQITPYLYLKDTDICFTDIDKRFVDFYPQYTNYEIPVEYKRVIDKFISIFMPKNESPTVEVVYE